MKDQFLLLYGSETGQSESIAEEIASQALDENLEAKLCCVDKFENEFDLCAAKGDLRVVVVVCSSTGDGDPPENARRFVRKLRDKSLPRDFLDHIRYAFLALGDTNYTTFCGGGKTVENCLKDLGAKSFYATGYADDGTGLEEVVEPWIEGLWAPLKAELRKVKLEAASEIESGSSRKGGVEAPDTELPGEGAPVRHPHEEVIKAARPGSRDNGVLDPAASERIRLETSDMSGSRVESEVPEAPPSVARLEALLEASEDLAGVDLVVPVLPQPFLDVTLGEGLTKPDSDALSDIQAGHAFAGAESPWFWGRLVASRQLTPQGDTSVKRTVLLTIDVSDCRAAHQSPGGGDVNIDAPSADETKDQERKQPLFKPGDSFAVFAPNDPVEVKWLINRLGMGPQCRASVHVSVRTDTKKKAAKVPPFLPQDGVSLGHLLTTCVDIRATPKKAFLRALAECCPAASPDRRRLLELCSKQGASEYQQHVREARVSFLDLLATFALCRPPLATVLEHLPRLMTRAYSACNYAAGDARRLVELVYSDVQVTSYRKGLCTSWLNSLTPAVDNSFTPGAEAGVESLMDKLSLESGVGNSKSIQLPMYLRENTGQFYPPLSVDQHYIMIGPGVGVAPFRGFLQYRQCQLQLLSESELPKGEVWLFTGCRFRSKDWIFNEELKSMQNENVLTKLVSAFSRDSHESETPVRYVQHNITVHGERLVELVCNLGAIVYVCGDAENMAKDVWNAFKNIFQKYKGQTIEDSEKYMWQLSRDRKYIQDVWT